MTTTRRTPAQRLRDTVLLTLGSVGFLSQIIAQFTGHEPSYLLMGASLSVLLGVPLIRFEDRRNGA